MPVYKVEGIVLRRQALGEADRVLTLFTREHGRIRAAARGTRRVTSRLAGRLEPYTHAGFLLARGRTLDVVAQVDVLDAFPGLRTDLLRSAYAAYVAELTDRFLPERDRHDEVFTLVLDALAVLSRAEADEAELHALWFALHLASMLGYRPEVEACVVCGRPRPAAARGPAPAWTFSPAAGGLLCPACGGETRDGLRVPPAVPAICAHLLRAGSEQARRLRVAPEGRRDLSRLVQTYLEYRLEARLRSPAVIARLREAPRPAAARV